LFQGIGEKDGSSCTHTCARPHKHTYASTCTNVRIQTHAHTQTHTQGRGSETHGWFSGLGAVWCVRGLVKDDLLPFWDSQDASSSTDFPEPAEAATSHSRQEFSSPPHHPCVRQAGSPTGWRGVGGRQTESGQGTWSYLSASDLMGFKR
jgi:hypothetical protein